MMSPPADPDSPSLPNENTVYILGVGNIGLLFAHSLAQVLGPQSIILLFHRENLVQEWDQAGQEIYVVSNGIPSSTKGYQFEVLQPPGPTPSSHIDLHNTNVIHNLIVATKAANTLPALVSVRHRLSSCSSVLFCQNGMGIFDELKIRFPFVAHVWPRGYPQYLTAIVFHGVHSQQPFSVVHAGYGKVVVGPIHPLTPADPTGTPFLIELLNLSTALAVVHVSAPELLQTQLQKLVVNSIINPLSVIFNCQNGYLFSNSQEQTINKYGFVNADASSRLMHLLLSEACQVIQSLPEARNLSGKEEIFALPRMKEFVIQIADKTSANTSSMLQDFRANRKSEVQYMNGYIVQKGLELGINCEINARVVRIMEDRNKIQVGQIIKVFPELLNLE